MDIQLLVSIGNLGQRPFGVEVDKHFGGREIHGPFNTENAANNYMHGLIQETGYFGQIKHARVVNIVCQRAGKAVVWVDGGPLAQPGSFQYA